jgi:hypothetical protein
VTRDQGAANAAAPAVDWARFQQCPGCGANLGQPCVQLSGFVVTAGVAVGLEGGTVEVPADRPHGGRKQRAGVADRG